MIKILYNIMVGKLATPVQVREIELNRIIKLKHIFHKEYVIMNKLLPWLRIVYISLFLRLE